ncbi:tyrosinase-like protein 2 [Ruditapes philippinarum]|uniref:tyrosinase-like protein 2 n=1 Tax=Ruditapes philippinarum TaxID=129788 RepID=UPI00295B17C8|nr:tyrosinase-like protein 2 [Ruditapes philippinarum]
MKVVSTWLCVAVLLLVALFGILHVGKCQILEADMPVEVVECFQLLGNNTGGANPEFETSDEIYIQCLQQFLWKEESIQWSDFNITEKDKGFINSLIGSLVRRGRQKRQIGPVGIFPRTGFRIRREYRRISDGERFALHSAINQMKSTGQYDTFANLHQGIVINSAHGGPNFLGWHRVYLALVEEDLRMINPRLSLPYWDSTLDFDMVDPVESIIWTESFLGNGNGFVTTGPFANWIAGANQLTRNIGEGSTLFTKESIRMVLTRCRIRDITAPTAMVQFNLERYHGGPHNWVGGQMSGLNTAAHDPVFFLHHAFVDYIWELFRIRQARFCGVNPSTDYPPTMGLHAAERPMDGFPQYRNVDGYRSYWTQFWYRYERSPTCSMWQPFCGSPYLRCDMARQRCVSMARMGPSPLPAAAGFGASLAADSPSSPASAMAARAQAATVLTGPRFVAPPPEPRTQDARLSMGAGRMRRSANQNLETKTDIKVKGKSSSTPMDVVVGPVSEAPDIGDQTVNNPNNIFSGGIIGIDQDFSNSGTTNNSLLSLSEEMQLLPTPNYHEITLTDLLRPPAQNTFIINDHVDVAMWAFIPVKVLYTSNLENPVLKFLNRRNHYSKHPNEPSLNSSSIKFPNKRCIQDESGAMQVRIQSVGLNYNGEYSGYALIDRHLPVDSATTYIGVKSPETEHTEVVLSAVHSCGLMCQAYCFVQNTVPPEFKPCSGALKISSQDPNVYGRTYEEAVSRVWQGVISGGGVQNENLRIIFDCSDDDKAPWFPGNDVFNNTISSF